MNDNMWVVTARVTDKIHSMGGEVSTGLGDWTRATFRSQTRALEFDIWVKKQTIAGRLITSQGVAPLDEGGYLVRFK